MPTSPRAYGKVDSLKGVSISDFYNAVVEHEDPILISYTSPIFVDVFVVCPTTRSGSVLVQGLSLLVVSCTTDGGFVELTLTTAMLDARRVSVSTTSHAIKAPCVRAAVF